MRIATTRGSLRLFALDYAETVEAAVGVASS